MPLPGQGAVARRGAAWLKHVEELDKAGVKPRRGGPPVSGGASAAWRKASGLDDAEPGAKEPRAKEPRGASRRSGDASKRPRFAERLLGDDGELVVEDSGSVRDVASRAVRRGSEPARRTVPTGVEDGRPDLADDVRSELHAVLPNDQRKKFERRLADASGAFGRERFIDAARMLKPLAEEAPGATSVRELYGLALYRQGKWKAAARQLEAFRELSGSTEQHPVLADSYRALEKWDNVERLWDELKAASPSAELMVEGRIVTAGARADQGDIAGGIELLEQAWKLPKRPREHHLRRGYALADLYERAGEMVRARELFAWIARHDSDFADVSSRAR